MAPNQTMILGYPMSSRMWKYTLETLILYKTSTIRFHMQFRIPIICLFIFPLPKYYMFICRNTMFQEKYVFLGRGCFIEQLLITCMKCQESWEGRKKNHTSFSVALLVTELKYSWLAIEPQGFDETKRSTARQNPAASISREVQDMTLVDRWRVC